MSRSIRRYVGLDAALATVVVAVILVMIVPLPSFLLDVLLASNLGISVSILLITLYTPSALKLVSFPTVLLVTTLIRVALSIAATRLILLNAYAGNVIDAFGRVVIGNNYVVGAVVFVVLIIVQYLVVAKGSERVAEVGARFTLDALPGKQLGIDAELRAGAIDAATARHQRQRISRESQFYGSMDGAMKFVKGDVVASILIALVNIVGGLVIGVTQRNLSVGAALKRFGLLTIGNGLVTLLAALIMATAAGVLVTRVSSEDSPQSLAADLSTEWLETPRALLIASIFIVGLAALPGMPALPFLLIGVVLFFASRARARFQRQRPQPVRVTPVVRDARTGAALRFVPVIVPWSLQWGPTTPQVGARQTEEVPPESLHSATEWLRERLFLSLGLALPACHVEPNRELGAGQLQLLIHELPCASVELPSVTDATADIQCLVTPLLTVLQQRAAEFLGMSETQALLDELERVRPDTARHVVPKPISLGLLSEVLRHLVAEGVSIRDLSSVLYALAQAAPNERDPLVLAEHVRVGLRRSITHQLTAGEPKLGVITMDPSVEEVIRAAIVRTGAGTVLALAPDAAADIVRSIRRALDQASAPEQACPILLVAADTRRFVRQLVQTELPNLRVIAPSELLPEIGIVPLATVTVVNL